MPSPLVILRFRRQDDSIFYRAFSSSDEDRPLYKFDADLHYEIGNQRLHEDDMSSVLGTILSKHVFEDCQIPLAERNNGVQVFMDGSGNIVEDAGITPSGLLSLNDQSSGTLHEVEHQCVDPTSVGNRAEPSSDSD